MKHNKTTADLQQELMSAPSFDVYLSENIDTLTDRNVPDRLAKLYHKCNLSKATLARQAGMSEVYLHQVFSGRRNPSRDRILCLCIGMSVSVDETQELLKQVGYAQLYPKNKRDSIIIFGLLHGMDLNAINDNLFMENEKTLV